jgi:hypothetical protein
MCRQELGAGQAPGRLVQKGSAASNASLISVLWQPISISLSKISREVIAVLDLHSGPCGGLTVTSYLSSRRHTVIDISPSLR